MEMDINIIERDIHSQHQTYPVNINQPALTWPVQEEAIIGEYRVRAKPWAIRKSLTWTVHEFWLHREANIDYLRELWERFTLAIYTERNPKIATVRSGTCEDSLHGVLKPVFANIACLQIWIPRKTLT